MIQFLAPEIETLGQLPAEESRHAVRVLRMQAGDEVMAVDGRGFRYRCRMVDPAADGAIVEVLEKLPVPKPWTGFLTLAIAPTKHMDRMEWLVEKAVEIGVDRIVPLRCRHSERKEIKAERLRKIAVSAMKQSLKAQVPEIAEMMPIKQFLSEPAAIATQRFVCYCDEFTPRAMMAPLCRPGADTSILIGPEGDFSPEEISMARNCGYVPVTLGEQRLRTETAALYALATVHVAQALSQWPASES